MKTFIVLATILSLFVCGCCKEKMEKNNTPECISQKISDPIVVSQLSIIDSYTFQGKTVFTLAPDENITDGATKVVDENCTTLGILGGLKGFTKINGVEFFANAVFITNIWKKN